MGLLTENKRFLFKINLDWLRIKVNKRKVSFDFEIQQKMLFKKYLSFLSNRHLFLFFILAMTFSIK